VRLFAAILLPEDARRRLAGLAGGLPGARWTPEETYHLTLRFIGEVDNAAAETLAEAHYLRAIALDPARARPYFKLGTLYVKQKRKEEAQHYLGRFEELAPYADDLAQLRDRLRREPDNALAQYALARIYAKLNMPSLAIGALRSCLAVRPDYAPAYNNLGNAHLRLGDTEEAIALYEAAVRLDTAYALAYNNLASALLLNGQLPAALERYQRALRIRPDYADAYYGLAMAYRQQGLHAEAGAAMGRYERIVAASGE